MTVAEAERLMRAGLSEPIALLREMRSEIAHHTDISLEEEDVEDALAALDFLLAELARKDEALGAADAALAACGCVWTGGCRNQKVRGPCSVCAARDLITAALGEQP